MTSSHQDDDFGGHLLLEPDVELVLHRGVGVGRPWTPHSPLNLAQRLVKALVPSHHL